MRPDRYAVFGNPIAHSHSPFIHAAFAAQTRQALTYEAILAPPDGFADALALFWAEGGRGANVTLPFKVEAARLADDRRPAVAACGAANALAFVDGRVIADNFDGAALADDIVRNLGVALRGRRVLIAGAGGATRGALRPLAAEAPAEIVIAHRRRPETLSVAAEGGTIGGGGVNVDVRAVHYAQLVGEGAFGAVINATSASLSGARPPIPASVYAPGALAYELVYGKGLTPFLNHARQAGAGRLADGLGMLVEQAAAAFAWWRGVRPHTAPVIAALIARAPPLRASPDQEERT